jgi:leader peptidase (prepilin peptidase)/N-methyltransferase
MRGILLAFLLGTVIRIGLISLRLRSHRDLIPFRPFLALGTVVTVLWGEPLLRWFTGA